MPSKKIGSQLREYYRNLPNFDEEFEISNVVHMQKGWESEIYAFDLQPLEGEAQELILRIYPGADAVPKSEGEFKNLALLALADFPVPKVHIYEKEHSPFRAPFVIMDRIPGQTLWSVIFEARGETQAKLIDAFSQIYVQLHSLDCQPFLVDQGIEHDPGSQSVVISQLNNWQAFYDSFPIPEFLPLMNWLGERAWELTTSMLAVLHWDFHPENVILRPDGSLVVIDWTGLQVSDLRFDLAWTLMLITAYEGAQWRAPFLDSYERYASMTISEMDFFDVAACTRRLYSIAGSMSDGAEKMGMRPGAEETMRGQIQPARAVYETLLKNTGITLPSIESWLSQ